MDKPEQIEAVLMPCPFCGGEADVESPTCGYFVACIERGCGAKGPWPDDSGEAEAIAAWNTRTPSITGEDTELIERLRAALKSAHEFTVMFIAFDGRDRHTSRMDKTLDSLVKIAVAVDAHVRQALTGGKS